MGCYLGKQEQEDSDREVLKEFLDGINDSLRKIWIQFNKNDDEVLDRSEFDRLLFTALQLFCQKRDPEMAPPTRESMDPFIEKLRNELAPRVDTDGDGVISFDEFKIFAQYLKKEFNKLQIIDQQKHSINNDDNDHGKTNTIETEQLTQS
mmetsp:Transcript_33801/g.41638  ORF Transcript_33801/g.41638 Transcript_33801/m.41638 type:complete len:150 (-) Transcript_33801:32-481(-)